MKTQNDITTEDITTGTATYCPEDNKLRLYVGRVPRDEYLRLKAEGWKPLYKQREAGGGDFVALWTPGRRDTAMRYGEGVIEDEDMGPEERAADRAERFAGYQDKREGEALGHADRFDSGPAVHGFQNRGRAVRAADRHDKIAGRAVDAWEKAEYWQRRTAGVISHRLHLSSPAVRMGRIKELEASIRKSEKNRDEYERTRALWVKCAGMTDVEAQNKLAARLAYVEHGNYKNPHSGRERYLYDFSGVDVNGNPHEGVEDPCTGAELCALYLAKHGPLAPEGPWLTHYRLRLAYELQMLEAQGGRAASVEMEAGGWLRGGRHLSDEERQIIQVNKSPATKRVVSVLVRDNHPSSRNHWGNPYPDGVTKVLVHTVKVERMSPDAYRAPTEDERAAFKATTDATKKARAKVAKEKREAGEGCPLVNPTDEDAERLQELWNDAEAREPAHRQKVLRMTQKEYSARSQGSFARCSTAVICETGREHRRRYGSIITRHDVFKVRQTYGEGSFTRLPSRVIVLTDVAQKPLPWAALEKARAACPSEEALWDRMGEIAAAVRGGPSARESAEVKALLSDAEYVGWISQDSWSQVPFTEKGIKALRDWEAEDKASVVASSAPVAPRAEVVAVSAPVVVDSDPRVQLSLF